MSCEVSAAELGRVLRMVERGDPEAIRAAAELGPAGAEMSLAASLTIEPPARRAGLFVVLTGIDRAGKETHAFNPAHIPGVRPLVDVLGEMGYEVLGVRQPEYGFASGQLIRSYLGLEGWCRLRGKLEEDVAWILWSMNRALVNRAAAHWLSKDGRAVIAKRWGESNLAYHAPQGVEPSRILSLESRFLRPDVFLVLDLDPSVAASRMEGGADAFESRARLLSEARRILLELDRYFPGSEVIRVDASRSPASVSAELVEALRRFLSR